MTEQEWTNADVEFKARMLNGLPDAEGIAPDAPWDTLPYWLKRTIIYFVLIATCRSCGYVKHEKTFQRDRCPRCNQANIWTGAADGDAA